MTETAAAIFVRRQRPKNALAPVFRAKIFHRTSQAERHDPHPHSTMSVFTNRSHSMKTYAAIVALSIFLANVSRADPQPCIMQLHSPLTESLIVITADCPPLATQVTVYRNDDPIYRVTLPPPLNAKPGALVFIVNTGPGVNMFSATSNDVAPEPGNPPEPERR